VFRSSPRRTPAESFTQASVCRASALRLSLPSSSAVRTFHQ
jgi:hypothetical protein